MSSTLDRVLHPTALAELAERFAVRERARALRIRVLEELQSTVQSERNAARVACAARLREARAILEEVGRSRVQLSAERQLQRDLRAAEQADRERRRHAPPTTCGGCRVESDDDVLTNISSDLAALYDRVKTHAQARAPYLAHGGFPLKWAEAHPSDVLEATAHPADAEARELDAVAPPQLVAVANAKVAFVVGSASLSAA